MNTDYEIVLFREDDVWVALCPELTGCATHADTREAALARLVDLIPHWMEACRESGVSIPEPQGRLAFA